MTAPRASTGHGIPSGGELGQVLAKNSDREYDAEWIDPPAGGGAGGTSYRHVQDTPATTWTINHNLGYYPNVWTQINLGTLTEARGDIDHTNVNTVVVTFSTAVTGQAYVS